MVPEITSIRLSSVQGAMYQGKCSYILDIKIGFVYNIILLGLWISEVGIYDVVGTNIRLIQSRVGKHDSHAVS